MAQKLANHQAGMPALYYAADQSSTSSQTRFFRITAAQLILLAVAAATVMISWRSGGINYAALVGAAAIVFAGVMRVHIQTTDPTKTWYQGRAVAGSVERLAWRYAVGGAPFPVSLSEAEADQRMVERLQDIVLDLEGLNIVDVGDAEEITPWMRESRRLPLEERKRIYEHDRIQDQRSYYSSKSHWNSQQASRWGIAMLLFEAFGVLQALLKATGVVEVSILGFTATVIAGIAAWIQTKDYNALASSYAVASRELSTINALIRHQTTEEEWASFVAEAEGSLAREQTQWRVSKT